MEKNSLTRRDFLKLSALTSVALNSMSIRKFDDTKPPNILMVVYDSWSTTNTYLDDYPRDTMPHLKQLAEKAIVYHNHYAGANFTSPGTASLLTGTSTKLHRAFAGNSKVISALDNQNLFSQFQTAGYQTLAYTHNNYANTLLNQFSDHLDEHIPINSLFLNKSTFFHNIFGRDFDIAFLSRDQILDDTPSNSLLFSKLYRKLTDYCLKQIEDVYLDDFPSGIPKTNENYFLLEDATNHIIETTRSHQAPFLGYYHLLPPHDPYRPPKQFFNQFQDDDASLIDYPEHPLAEGHKKRFMREQRKRYDEFLLYVDEEINRLYQALAAAGTLENTILVLTSDHGELNDRGFIHHGKATLHEPVIRIPLYIFMPGQTERIDITDVSTAMDLMPTFLSLAGRPVPEMCEGGVLPPFATTSYYSLRPFFIIHSTSTHSKQKVEEGTFMVMRDGYKLTKYLGYEHLAPGQALYEMYNLSKDPHELQDIYREETEIAAELSAELDDLLQDEDVPA